VAGFQAPIDGWFSAPNDNRRVSPEFAVLELSAGASREAVNAAYRSLAWQHHPDRGDDPAKFKELQAAYEKAMGR
jgi:DnaJ-class molecular chaperone